MSPVVFEKSSRASRERLVNRVREDLGEAPGYTNLGPAVYFTNPHRLPFRGRMWEVRPISWEDGVRVLQLIQDAEGMKDNPPDLVERYGAFMGEAVRMIRRLVCPDRGHLRRFLWRVGLVRNPWRTATDREVAEMLGFFYRLRTMSGGTGAREDPTKR